MQYRTCDNEYTRKEKPCPLAHSEYCDNKNRNCGDCIALEEEKQIIDCIAEATGMRANEITRALILDYKEAAEVK